MITAATAPAHYAEDTQTSGPAIMQNSSSLLAERAPDRMPHFFQNRLGTSNEYRN